MAKFAFVTAILESDGKPQIWITVRTTGQMLKLGEGDTFTVGGLTGSVTSIDARKAELAIAGKRLVVSLGDSLKEARELAASTGR